MSWSDPVLVLATCPAYWCPDHVLHRKEITCAVKTRQTIITAPPHCTFHTDPGTPWHPWYTHPCRGAEVQVQRRRCRRREEVEGGGGPVTGQVGRAAVS